MIKILPNFIAFSLLFGFAFYVKQETTLIKHSSQVSIAREADIISALNDLASQVAAIKADHQSISELKTQLTHIEQTMATEQSLSTLAKSAELQQMATFIKKLRQSPDVAHSHPIHKRHSKKSAVLKTALPFTVESIDTIAGQPFASVLYHQETLPIRLNDALAGWKAVQIDMGAGMAIWENAQRRRIKIMAARFSA